MGIVWTHSKVLIVKKEKSLNFSHYSIFNKYGDHFCVSKFSKYLKLIKIFKWSLINLIRYILFKENIY